MRIIDHGRVICMRSFVSTVIPQLLLAAFIMLGMPAQGEASPPPADKIPADTRDAAPAKPSNGWGPELDGLRTRLVPAQKDYSIGRPAKFRLEMKNFGAEARTYDPQQADCNNAMQVTDRDKKPVPYIAGSYQTAGHAESLAPGETVVLFDQLDLGSQYLLVEPGSYTIQFRGLGALGPFEATSAIPTSEAVTIEMQPGTLPPSLRIAAAMLKLLPRKWQLSLNQTAYGGQITVPGWGSRRGIELQLTWIPNDSSYKNDLVRVDVWLAEEKLTWTGNVKKPYPAADYVGKGPDGHVYWIVPASAEKAWPDIRASIKATLTKEE